jgi:tRNA(adenine34) deaminase
MAEWPGDERQTDERMMRQAIREAELALEADDVPVGAVIVHGGRIIGRGHNQRERLQDPTAHAEIIALTAAAAERGSWRMEGCTLYVTLEPCVMCAGAIVLARIDRLVFGADDPKAGACGSIYNVVEDRRLNHQPAMTTGILADQCGDLLRSFFARQRGMGKK